MKHTTLMILLLSCLFIFIQCDVQQRFDNIKAKADDHFDEFKDKIEDATTNLKASAKDQVKEKLHLKYIDQRNMPNKAGDVAKGFKKSLEHVEKILREGSQAVKGGTRREKSSHAYKAMRETVKFGESVKDIFVGWKDIAVEGAKDAAKEAYTIYRKHGSKGEKVKDAKDFVVGEMANSVKKVKSELKSQEKGTFVGRILEELSSTVGIIKGKLGISQEQIDSLKEKIDQHADESSDNL